MSLSVKDRAQTKLDYDTRIEFHLFLFLQIPVECLKLIVAIYSHILIHVLRQNGIMAYLCDCSD